MAQAIVVKSLTDRSFLVHFHTYTRLREVRAALPDLHSMIRAMILVLMTLSAVSPTLGFGRDLEFAQVVHYDLWEG